MTSTRALMAPHVQAFFTVHRCHQTRVSPQTMASCRDTFRLLLPFVHATVGIAPSALCVPDLDAPTILAFLDHLEPHRGNTVRSRNIRLSALRTFFRFVALRDPESVTVATRVRALPRTREDKKLIGYLTRDEMAALLAAPDRSHWAGRRDHALLLTMYHSGARVSEITARQRAQVCFGATPCLDLHGKGRQERTVPLWPPTSRVLQAWFREGSTAAEPIVFPNARGKPLTRHGSMYLLPQVVRVASRTCPSLRTKTVSPHVIRHTTAMHVLHAGVDIAVMALWLGHESIETTHVYLEADLATKERALQKLAPIAVPRARFTPDDPLLAFLTSR